MQYSDIILCLYVAKQQNLRFFLYVRFNMFVSNALTNTLQLPLPTENMFRFGNFGIFTVKKKLSFKGALSLRKRYFKQHCRRCTAFCYFNVTTVTPLSPSPYLPRRKSKTFLLLRKYECMPARKRPVPMP